MPSFNGDYAVALSQSVAPVFTGSPLGTHAHTMTPAGAVSQPVFTGAPLSTLQPSIAVYRWRRTA